MKALWSGAICRRIIIGVIILVCVIVLELFISNARMLFTSKQAYTLDYEALGAEMSLSKGKDTKYKFTFPSRDVYAIRISTHTERDFSTPVKLQIKVYDEKRSESLRTAATTYISPGSDKLVWLDYTSPENNVITVELTEVTASAKLTGITVNPSNTFGFNFFRAAIILLIAATVYLIRIFALDREYLDFSKTKHRVVVFITIGVCLLGVLIYCIFFVGVGRSYGYPLSSDIENYDPYTQQLDAFIKGQIHLDCEVSDELLRLENPYDHSQREGINYLWDRALYEGKYYSYFGIAPIINVYFPHYLVTGKIIHAGAVKLVYALIATAFALATLYAFVIAYKKRVKISHMSLYSVALTVCSGIMLMARSTAHFYYIPVLAGMAYISKFLFFMLFAIFSKHKILRPIFFALAGLSYGMLFLSRVNMALLCAFIVLPILYFVLIRNKAEIDTSTDVSVKRTVKQKISDLACLGAPVIIAIVAAMAFNAVRFGSPFEFGAKYQLTVSDVSKNEIDFSSFIQMLYHSFFAPFKAGGSFPFFTLQLQNLNDYGGYLYVDAGMGLFAIPLMLALIFGVHTLTSKKKTPFAKSLCLSLVVGVIAVAVMNFYIGGVIYRYTCDLTLLCAIASILFLISVNEEIYESSAEKTILVAEKLLLIVSIFVCLNVLTSLHGYLSNAFSQSFVMVEELFR